MNIECSSPRRWKTTLEIKNKNSFLIELNCDDKKYFKEISKLNNPDIFKKCLILYQKKHTSWIFQKFDFEKFEEDIDFSKMIENQYRFAFE